MPDHQSNEPNTVCPRCGVGCRLQAGPNGVRANGVVGPANPNGRLCRKGIGALETPDDRLEDPLIRQNGDLQPVSWPTAYERIAESFEEILAARGPDALAFLGAPHCTNEENYLLQKLARILGTNNVDNRSRLCHVSTTRALSERVGWPATTNGLEDLTDADVIVVAGANPAERQPIAFNSFVRPAVTDGATLVHVDPVGNRTTRLADIHLTPRPGTDALVFDLLSARIVDDGAGIDREFVENRTRGFEQFEASITDLERDETRLAAGVESSALEEIADRITAADRVAGLVGTGIENSAGETNASGALLNLLLLTGNLGRRGAGLYVLRGLANEQGATDAGCVPDRLPGHQPVTDSRARARIASEWGVEPPSTPGKTATELLESFGNDVRGALVVGENPGVSKRDPEWVRERLGALETLVVVELAANETTEHADVVLPAAAGIEKAGTFTNLERRVQRLSPIATPPARARSDFRILAELGGQLTQNPSAFEYEDVSEAFGELRRIAPPYAGLRYDDLGLEGERWPAGSPGALYRETFETPDGRAQFGSAQPPIVRGSTDGFWLVTGGRSSGSHDAETSSELRINPADAREIGVDADETVVVSSGDVSIRVTARLAESVRAGTLYVPAAVADPFLRRDVTTVSVDPA
ncbi:molybdopterin oxidoreductase family protein [Halostagnicola kamekurae]|uniref:Formate dehydrogenase major subunit n=1 Tax=Halostagnicola kamekurae TaxID=619731 RepID=A0A1I6TFH4_9EURY|nr:molybdopterin-dependent oxidoreductase [Halostagnicola kamekurae]SFS87868.1 formate dehydrogenase major subunit [Halostagnicola kamekurae]